MCLEKSIDHILHRCLVLPVEMNDLTHICTLSSTQAVQGFKTTAVSYKYTKYNIELYIIIAIWGFLNVDCSKLLRSGKHIESKYQPYVFLVQRLQKNFWKGNLWFINDSIILFRRHVRSEILSLDKLNICYYFQLMEFG